MTTPLQKLLAASRRKANKYGAERTGTHASKKEHNRAVQLQLLQRAGVIAGLREQVPFVLVPAQYGDEGGKRRCIEREVRYVADFVYTDPATGLQVVEDTKGFRTKEYIIKRKLMLHVHGIRIKEL